jgi:hypothetical protein
MKLDSAVYRQIYSVHRNVLSILDVNNSHFYIKIARTMKVSRDAAEPGKRSRRPDRFWGPPSLLSNGYRGHFPQGREADHSLPTSAEVKHTWIYTSTPPYAFMA